MRPPMQTAALQQNESSKHHSHHQQHQLLQQPQQEQHQQQQQQHQQQQHQQQQQQQQHQQISTVAAHVTDLTLQQPRRKSTVQQREVFVENNRNFACSAFVKAPERRSSLRTYRQPFVRNSQNGQDDDDDNDDDDSIRLVDLSTSPPNVPPHTNLFHHAFSTQQRSTFISDYPYSRSSSSEDNSLSGERFQRQQQQQLCTRANTFDDAAENFIINFPADSSPAHNPNDCVLNLPLSETEPLLTNIEATVADKQRAIRLHKNSASLIFTKKELPITSNNNANYNGASIAKQTTAQRRHHHSLRSSNENSNRKNSKHLPATYHYQQQHRRSLQLNYNNNLVTTSTCNANNNHCCALPDVKCGSGGSGGAVLHKPHQHYRDWDQQQSQSHSGLTANSAANTTAAATRKQHAYSWYAPVYSALEEELEQDSRDSSPLHNLANTKKNHTNQHHIRSNHNSSTATDNETVALLETRNQINIQAQLHTQSNWEGSSSASNGLTPRRKNGTAQVPSTLALQHSHNTTASSFSVGGTSESSSVLTLNSYDAEGPLAGSLGLAGGPMPRRRRFENFLKSLVGLRPSNGRNSSSGGNDATATTQQQQKQQMPPSPEITITRTPSEQNVVVMRDPSGRCQQQLANGGSVGSTSSLNVVQQKLWNIMRREGSAASLHQEKSQSIVQYTGLRKCETVLALTRQTNSLRSPVLGAGHGIIGGGGGGGGGGSNSGSGIFNANGVEQIRPLNRLRNSVNSINATCSRCSSLLSLAATGSRYSLNAAANGGIGGFVNTVPCGKPPLPPLHQRHLSNVSSSNVSCSNSRSPENVDDINLAAAIGGAVSVVVRSISGNCSRKSSNGANSTQSVSSLSPPSNTTTATLDSSYTASASTSPITPTAVPTIVMSPSNGGAVVADKTKTTAINCAPNATDLSVVGFASNANNSTTKAAYPLTVSSLLSVSNSATSVRDVVDGAKVKLTSFTTPTTTTVATASAAKQQPILQQQQQQQQQQQHAQTQAVPVVPFQMFTCKLCLVDVESASEATTLLQCGCQFCTECMKAYVEFEISEGAYEISCPDAQCPTQGAVTLPEIANLTTVNLMKKHHRYRLNREIELDKSRTWCPRAGCETVCNVGACSGDAATTPNAKASTSTATTKTQSNATSPAGGGEATTALQLCVVQCPSCKDEFCAACKKSWHPSISCEEHSRRLVADGQDDIGIPFDNDLIKCCPMCAVPIEKDEGCAQMMCKRCKHVFCWYCLASLDDDFLLRHYDKGPCKNKLGHSRASVVWHRAQVIGIFAGFGILLLVASPLLLLAAPCIICCKCRSCSGSKIDEGDGDLDEATALQS